MVGFEVMEIYLKFYKPFEVLCQFTDKHGRVTLKDYIPIQDVYSIGRLDYRSEGLLILSNDGRLSHLLTDPRYFHVKKYLIQVEGVIKQEAVDILNNEIVLTGFQTQLPKAQLINTPEITPRSKPVRNYHPTSWIEIEIGEGKKHQIRRMTAAVGYPTLRLVRVSIADIALGNLEPGEWCYLTNQEVAGLKNLG
jgi:23S rRNA pseudouridine2457 synthase